VLLALKPISIGAFSLEMCQLYITIIKLKNLKFQIVAKIKRNKMIRKTGILCISALEKLMKLPEGVYIGGVQHNVVLDKLDLVIIDPNNVIPEDMVFSEEKGWYHSPSKGTTLGG
jgi:hypothetical protein